MKDLTGKRFGKLTVVRRAEKRKEREQPKWECICDCGNRTEVFTGNLVNGLTKSCGCLYRESRHRKRINLEKGTRFGKLTVIERVEEEGRERWRVKCDCGAEKIVYGYGLRNGWITDCGCERGKLQQKRIEKFRKRLEKLNRGYLLGKHLTAEQREERNKIIQRLALKHKLNGAVIGRMFGLTREAIRGIVEEVGGLATGRKSAEGGN